MGYFIWVYYYPKGCGFYLTESVFSSHQYLVISESNVVSISHNFTNHSQVRTIFYRSLIGSHTRSCAVDRDPHPEVPSLALSRSPSLYEC